MKKEETKKKNILVCQPPHSPPEKEQAVNIDPTIKKTRKKRKKIAKTEEKAPRAKQSFRQDAEIQKQIDFLHEDIISVEHTPQRDFQQQQQQQQPTLPTQRENKIFIEMPRCFKEVKLTDGEIDIQNIFQPVKRKTQIRKKVDLALTVHKTCQKIISLLHGLITGAALWECVVIYSIRPPFFPHDDFSEHFSSTAPIVQRVFLTVLIICLVDVLDAGDVIRVKEKFLTHLIREWINFCLILLYSTSFILTVLTCDVETRYSEYLKEDVLNSTDWQVDLSEHETWWILTVLRAVCLSLSFVIISCGKPSENLTNLLREIKNSEQK